MRLSPSPPPPPPPRASFPPNTNSLFKSRIIRRDRRIRRIHVALRLRVGLGIGTRLRLTPSPFAEIPPKKTTDGGGRFCPYATEISLCFPFTEPNNPRRQPKDLFEGEFGVVIAFGLLSRACARARASPRSITKPLARLLDVAVPLPFPALSFPFEFPLPSAYSDSDLDPTLPVHVRQRKRKRVQPIQEQSQKQVVENPRFVQPGLGSRLRLR